MIRLLRSVEPSLTNMTSMCLYVCAMMFSMHVSKKCSALYTGTMIETNGLSTLIWNTFFTGDMYGDQQNGKVRHYRRSKHDVAGDKGYARAKQQRKKQQYIMERKMDFPYLFQHFHNRNEHDNRSDDAVAEK